MFTIYGQQGHWTITVLDIHVQNQNQNQLYYRIYKDNIGINIKLLRNTALPLLGEGRFSIV